MHGLEKENLPTRDHGIYSATFAAGTKVKEIGDARACVWGDPWQKNLPESRIFKDSLRPVPPHHPPASLEINREKPSSASYPRQSMEGGCPNQRFEHSETSEEDNREKSGWEYGILDTGTSSGWNHGILS